MDLAPRRVADTVVLAPSGRIDHASAEGFKEALQPYIERCAAGRDPLVVDFSGVEYISSAGLRVLMLARKQAKAQGGTIVIAALQPMVKEIFEIARFTLVFQIFVTVGEAVDRVRQ